MLMLRMCLCYVTMVLLLWEASYKDFAPELYGHAEAYSKAKEAVSTLLRQRAREAKQKIYPSTHIRGEIVQLGLILGARVLSHNCSPKNSNYLTT
jgi:hypothetical protein